MSGLRPLGGRANATGASASGGEKKWNADFLDARQVREASNRVFTL